MPTWIISFKHKVAGVLTDVTSATLRDAANTYGVRRTDTNAVIVASGTALTHNGTGLYSYSVPVTAGLSYQAQVEWVYGGETKRVERLQTIAADDATISAFTTKVSARTFGGPFNADTFFDKDNDADAAKIAAAWLDAGQTTDAEIQTAWAYRLAEAGITPAALAPTDANEIVWLRQTANWGIIIHGYEGRGEMDVGNELDGKMAGLRKRYEDRLRQIREGEVLFVASVAAGIELIDGVIVLDAPIAVGPTVNPDGTTLNAWPLLSIDQGRLNYG